MKKFPLIVLLLAASALSMNAMAEESSSSSSSSQPESGSAMQDLQNANTDGQEAVNAPSDEKAKAESSETFDTPHSDAK